MCLCVREFACVCVCVCVCVCDVCMCGGCGECLKVPLYAVCRHHVYRKGSGGAKDIDLKEVGPRFEMKRKFIQLLKSALCYDCCSQWLSLCVQLNPSYGTHTHTHTHCSV